MNIFQKLIEKSLNYKLKKSFQFSTELIWNFIKNTNIRTEMYSNHEIIFLLNFSLIYFPLIYLLQKFYLKTFSLNILSILIITLIHSTFFILIKISIDFPLYLSIKTTRKVFLRFHPPSSLSHCINDSTFDAIFFDYTTIKLHFFC